MLSQNPAGAVDVPGPRRATMKALDSDGVERGFSRLPGVADPGVGEPEGVAALEVDSGDGGAEVQFALGGKESEGQDDGEREKAALG